MAVYELAGMPNSGKTAVSRAVSQYLRSKRIRVAEFNGGGRYALGGQDSIANLNLYLISKAVERMLQVDMPSGFPSSAHILDRGIVDRLIFTRALHSLGMVSGAQLRMMEELVCTNELQSRIAIAFVFTVDPGMSLSREAPSLVDSSYGKVMNLKTLSALYESTMDFFKDAIPPCTRRVFHIDTTECGILSAARIILKEIAASAQVDELVIPNTD